MSLYRWLRWYFTIRRPGMSQLRRRQIDNEMRRYDHHDPYA